MLELLRHLIELCQLILGGSQLRQFGLDVGFFLGFCLLVSLYLGARAAALAGLLQKIGADALGHWKHKKDDKG